MLCWIANRIDALSAKPWVIIAVFALQSALLLCMLALAKPFAAIVGAEPIDFQTSPTPAELAAQLPSYNATARKLYYGIAALDFGFPLLGGLFWGLLLAAGLRAGWPAWYRTTPPRTWLALPLVGTVCDWLENIGILSLLGGYPPFNETAAAWTLLAKQAKLSVVSVIACVTIGVFLLGTLRYGRRSWTQRRKANES